ncbi:MAG TPA: hypothetical protein VL945_01150 [Candidatus Saccharimonadales bacterium]|nr:hypothetical protein [Candidatus Saccharimonadales bacterium]
MMGGGETRSRGPTFVSGSGALRDAVRRERRTDVFACDIESAFGAEIQMSFSKLLKREEFRFRPDEEGRAAGLLYVSPKATLSTPSTGKSRLTIEVKYVDHEEDLSALEAAVNLFFIHGAM